MTSLSFRVCSDLPKRLCIGVSGSASCLGNWNPADALRLKTKDGVWEGVVSVSEDVAVVEYRYFTFYNCDLSGGVIVEKWESMDRPRTMELLSGGNVEIRERFGKDNEGKDVQIQTGWLLSHDEVHVSFENVPEDLWTAIEEEEAHSQLFMKCDKTCLQTNKIEHSCCLNLPLTVCVMGESYNQIHDEPVLLGIKSRITFKMPICCTHNQNISIHLTTGSGKTKGAGNFMVCSTSGEGGTICCAVMDPDHKLVSQLQATYLVIRSLPEESQCWSMKDGYCFTKDNIPENSCLFIGHRGSGTSRHLPLSVSVTREDPHENSLAGINLLSDVGAHFVEVDVVLTKDKVPIVHHDFITCVSAKKTDGRQEFTKVPVHLLTYEQLKNLRQDYYTADNSLDVVADISGRPVDEEEDPLTKPFTSLKDMLSMINPKVKVILEIKYPQQLKSGAMEDGIMDYVSRNEYADTVLSVLLRYAGDRKIVLGSFDIDLLTATLRKQNRYPGLLIQASTNSVYEAYMDSRTQTTAQGIDYCKSEHVLGIHGFSSNFVEYSSVPLIRENGLLCFCWGDAALQNWTTFEQLMEDGVQAFVIDRVLQLTREGQIMNGEYLYKKQPSQQIFA